MSRTFEFFFSLMGKGHVIRCAALEAELRSRGWSVRPAGVHAADVVVMDGHSSPDSTPPETRRVGIEDVPTYSPIIDLVVNGNAGGALDHYRGRKALVGPKYALLRATFRRERDWRADKWPHRIGIFDARAADGLNAEQMANAFARAKVAIVYGGMRALEAACVATPTVIVPQENETVGQRMNRDALVAANAAVTAGETNAVKVAENLLKGDPAWLREMGESATELVDGLGVERVADAIEALF